MQIFDAGFGRILKEKRRWVFDCKIYKKFAWSGFKTTAFLNAVALARPKAVFHGIE